MSLEMTTQTDTPKKATALPVKRRIHSGRIEVRPALKHIANLRATWRTVYQKACEHDGINPDSSFVMFSDDNPFVQFVNKAAGMYFDAIRTYQSGGYVGLTLNQR